MHVCCLVTVGEYKTLIVIKKWEMLKLMYMYSYTQCRKNVVQKIYTGKQYSVLNPHVASIALCLLQERNFCQIHAFIVQPEQFTQSFGRLEDAFEI